MSGTFTSIGGQTRGFAAIDPKTGNATSNPGIAGVNAILSGGGVLYVGGAFNVPGLGLAGLAEIDTKTGAAGAWNPQAVDGSILALSVAGKSGVIAGGAFTHVGTPQPYPAVFR